MTIQTLRRPLIGVLLAGVGASACAGASLPERAAGPETAAVAASGAPLVRIAFGSCSDEDMAQPLWDPIRAADPGLWVWLGDIIYADTEDMELMRAKYRMQLDHPAYVELRRTVPVVGVWDDHDYGANNGGREYPKRAESQQLLLDFLGVPASSPRRQREGTYAAHTFGPEGRRVKVILLDVRYHRDPPGSGGTLLGAEQWHWLESQLRDTDAQIHLIGSGIQVLPVDHPYERWDAFPAERERLLRLIAESRAPGVVLLSGDRHIAEIMAIDDPRIGYPLYEVTSSGMTHSWEEASEPNRFRTDGLMTELNFGLIEVDWEGSPATVSLQVRDRKNEVRLEETVPLAELRPAARSSPPSRR
jgi:alkaline phosphatase D